MSTPISATGSTTTTTTGASSTSTTSAPSASSIISSAALGLGTTVPISQVLTGLMQVESIPLTQLQNQVIGVNTEISAYGLLNSALSTFQQSLAALTSPTEFSSYTATSSNTAALTASAVIGVQSGTYTVNTTQLAQAQSLATAGQASLNTSVTSGSGTSTVTIAFGTQNGSTFTQNAAQPGGSITINSSNNTLAGLRDAINNANLGVTATIVNDGSNTPYHLVLTSNQTGANQSMQISVQGDSGLASMLTYPPSTGDTMTQTVPPQDAKLTVNGLSLTSSSNSVGTAVPGLTLNLQQTGTSTVSVAANLSSAQTDIDNFVSAYNTLQSTIGQLTAYNPGGTNGPLIGDATTMQIQNQLQKVLASGLTGTGSGYSSLAAVGIGLNSDGTMSVNDSTLSQALQSNPSQFTALFGTAGSATNSNVTYLIGGTNTQPGSYAVNITQPATNGTFAGSSTPTYDTATGSMALTGSTTIASGTSMTVTINGTQKTVNLTPLTNATPAAVATQLQSDINSAFSSAGLAVTVTQNNGVLSVTPPSGQTISITDGTNNPATQLFGGSVANNSTTIPAGGMPFSVAVDGSAGNITVPQGIYTSSQLATALQTAINTNSTLQQAGVSVNVTQTNGILTIASASYGSNSSVNISGSGATQLFGGSATSTTGLNVAGTINGNMATGNGQVLTAGSGAAAGLVIQVTGNATGALGNVNYSQGYAWLLNSIVTNATDPTSGAIANATNTLNTQVTSLQTQETSLQTYISQVQQQYTSQFSALNAMVVQMQSTATFLQLTFNPPTSAS
ncbi:flagellar filament capping protein FliD [Paraburkholderia sediminicola]|uniref:Flagellar filament capping protein FliD n=1 Tax=Paraburkholderia rhynchosiae TaxID=487049 RepID=A0ACC7N9L4_9BURK